MVRHAEQPGQAVNIDLCFVPDAHPEDKQLPAVSGSSGHLVRCHRDARHPPAGWPGQVFAQPELTYDEAMQVYIAATRDRLPGSRSSPPSDVREGASAWRKEVDRQQIWHQIRQRRKQEDAEWRVAQERHHQARRDYQALAPQERQQAAWEQQQASWQQVQEQRKQGVANRKEENAAWHARNRQSGQAELTGGSLPWIAILVITDNCSRQCLGLPLFPAGAHLTSQSVVHALTACLPASLLYLISDQDVRFRTQAFAQLAQDRDFVHVPVYRHRPQSNGIAEHFVWTLKDWLRHAAWDSPHQLAAWLSAFRQEYNDRPHQGLPIPGLSPNEFALRLWLL